MWRNLCRFFFTRVIKSIEYEANAIKYKTCLLTSKSLQAQYEDTT